MQRIFNNFRLNILIRVLIIFGLLVLLSYAVIQTQPWILTNFIVGVFVIMLTWELVRYVEKTQVDLHNFLMAIKHKDFSLSYHSAYKGKSYARMYEAFNQIMESFRMLRVEKEVHYQHLQNIIEHISVALLCYKNDGEVVVMNKAAHELLGRPYLGNIHTLKRFDEKLYDTIRNIDSGEQELLKIELNGDIMQLSLRASAFKLREDPIKLVSIQDIQSELEAQEVESWQKLIRVLTHEIMNSVTPIVTLTSALNDALTDEFDQPKPISTITPDTEIDIIQGIQAIQNRSKGLLQFIHAYRNLTRVSTPNFEQIPVAKLFNRLESLFRPEWDKQAIAYTISISKPDLSLYVDPHLIEQVLINLIKNAMEAVKDRAQKSLSLRAELSDKQHVILRIADNGWGIEPELRDKVFVPFFTTKKQGTGIGLSLSRQIMRVHKGNITFQTEVGEGTVFSLIF